MQCPTTLILILGDHVLQIVLSAIYIFEGNELGLFKVRHLSFRRHHINRRQRPFRDHAAIVLEL